jgi:hypothetical protein
VELVLVQRVAAAGERTEARAASGAATAAEAVWVLWGSVEVVLVPRTAAAGERAEAHAAVSGAATAAGAV